MRRRLMLAVVIGTVLLAACGGSDDTRADDGPDGISPGTEGEIVTVSGILDAKMLDRGVCAWVETEEGKVEIWVDDDFGQVFNFLEDDTFEAIRAFDPTHPDSVGDVVFAAGDRISVTGRTYTSTPECGAYGVNATEPIGAV